MRKFASSLALVTMILFSGCSPAKRARLSGAAYAHNYRVTMYSGGREVRTFRTIGKVQNQSESDGYYFMEADTGRLIEVSGDVVIEQLGDSK